VLTAGVDLAAEPAGTALAVIDWSTTSATIVDLQLGVTDEPIVEVASQATKLGIDCALGWPKEFVNFMVQQSDVNLAEHSFDGGMAWRRTLAYRETDRNVREQTGRWPLSVSTDRLGLTAMRCAGLLSRLKSEGVEIDRSGSGLVAEVYPGASLRMWGFTTTGYRSSADVRRELLSEVKAHAPWFVSAEYEDLMISSCDAFDAVIAAFAARAVAKGMYLPPREDQLALAKVEGWVTLPQGTLHSLLG
jgi:predicted nuclease with RNAse H fold